MTAPLESAADAIPGKGTNHFADASNMVGMTDQCYRALTPERILEIAHRTASKYRHNNPPDKLSVYEFLPHHLIDFGRKLIDNERERCAGIAENMRTGLGHKPLDLCAQAVADAIRGED